MKTVKQIELWLENIPGRLSAVSELMRENRINIIACCYATTRENEGIFYFVANDPDKAVNALKAAGYKMEVKDVIACETPNHPGGLNVVLKVLKEENINVDYIYPCVGTGDVTVMIIGVGTVKKSVNILEKNWIRVFGKELYHI